MSDEEINRAFRPLARVLATRAARWPMCRGLTADDLEQEAMVAAYQAAPTFDGLRGVPISAYMRITMRRAIYDLIRGFRFGPRESRMFRKWLAAGGIDPVRFSEYEIHGEDPFEDSIADKTPGPAEVVEAEMLYQEILGSIDNDRERDIFVRRFARGEQLNAIGLAWGITASRANQILHRVMDRVRSRFHVEDEDEDEDGEGVEDAA